MTQVAQASDRELLDFGWSNTGVDYHSTASYENNLPDLKPVGGPCSDYWEKLTKKSDGPHEGG